MFSYLKKTKYLCIMVAFLIMKGWTVPVECSLLEQRFQVQNNNCRCIHGRHDDKEFATMKSCDNNTFLYIESYVRSTNPNKTEWNLLSTETFAWMQDIDQYSAKLFTPQINHTEYLNASEYSIKALMRYWFSEEDFDYLFGKKIKYKKSSTKKQYQ